MSGLEELARLEMKVDILARNQALAASALKQLDERVSRLEDRINENGQLTKEDVKAALVEAMDHSLKARNILLVVGVPTGMLAVVQLVMGLMR